MNAGQRLRATYEFKPLDHLVRKEFHFWDETIARWKREGLPEDYQQKNLFHFDPGTGAGTGVNLGWMDPPFLPVFECKRIKDEGATEVIQDGAGRWQRIFKGQSGYTFMPDFIKHPVTCLKDWEEVVAPRLDPESPARYGELAAACAKAARLAREEERMVGQPVIGGYMYLRSLMGPEELLVAFYDQPDLIHAMMRRWVELANAALTRIQAHVELDQISLGEDICYNHGPLISPDMIREFLLPYYQEVVGGARARQKRRLYLFVDSDGWVEPIIPLYVEAGMDVMTPFEVASGCDVVEIGRKWPDLVLEGGIDKRVLAAGPDAIERRLQHILPAMVKRGGYIPTCDHGVPDDVSLENYRYYRRRVCEMDH